MGEKVTASFLKDIDKPSPGFLSLIFSDAKRIEEAIYLPWYQKSYSEYRGIWGCNWGIRLKDIIDVNGFDEDYVNATVGEDVDIEWRLRQSGIKFKPLKHKAIVYHLFHKENYNNEVITFNKAIFEKKKKDGRLKCQNGIIKLTS